MNRTYRFAEYELHSEPLLLTARGEPVEATSQVLMLLHYLVQHPGEVVEKSRLLKEVWGHAHLTDAAFARAILRTRQVVNDDGRAQRIIRTVHGRGVMLVADVSVTECPEAKPDSTRAAATSNSPFGQQDSSGASPPASPTAPGRWLSAGVAVVLLIGLAAGAHLLSGTTQRADAAAQAEQTLVLSGITVGANEPELVELQASLPLLLDSILGADGVRILRTDPDTAVSDNVDWLKAGTALPEYFGADGVLDLQLEKDGLQFAIDYRIAGQLAGSGRVVGADRPTALRKLVTALRARLSGLGDQQSAALQWLADPLLADLVLRGSNAWVQGEATQAIQAFDAALAMDPANPLLQLIRLEARAEGELSPAEASAELKKLADSPAGLKLPLLRARILERAGTYAWYAGQPGDAIALLNDALSLARTAGAPFTASLARNSLAMAQQSAGDHRGAWENASLAAEELRAAGHHYHLAMALTNLGYLEEDRGRLSASSEWHREALAIREKFGFRRLLGASSYAVARIARRTGQLDEALELITRADELFIASGQSFDRIDAFEEKAEIFTRMGRFDEAEEVLNDAEQLATELEDDMALAWIDDVRGRLALQRGQNAEAVRLLAQSSKRQLADGEAHEARYTQIALAEAFDANGQVEDSIRLRAMLGKERATLSHDQRIALAVADLRAARRAGDPTVARRACDNALDLARISGTSDRETEAAIECGQVYLLSGDNDQARHMLVLASRWHPEFPALEPLQSGLSGATE